MSYATDLAGCIAAEGVPEKEGEEMAAALDMIGRGNTESQSALARRLLDMETEWKTRTEDGRTHEVRHNDFYLEWCDGNLWITGTEYMGGTRRDVLWQLNWIMAWIRLCCPGAKFSGVIIESDPQVSGEDADVWYEPDESGGAFCEAWATKTVRARKIELKNLA